MVEQNGASANGNQRSQLVKPKREPPAPPVPPKDNSPAQSCYSSRSQMNGNGFSIARSEHAYSEAPSFTSMALSTRSLQPQRAPLFKCSSARSESEYYSVVSENCSFCRCRASQCCLNACPQVQIYPVAFDSVKLSQKSCRSTPVGFNPHLAGPARPTPPPPLHQQQQQQQYQQQHQQQHQQRHQQQHQPPPVPLQRKNIPRPRLSISPKPELLRDRKKSKFQNGCDPLNFKRHTEQHIERFFKYLHDRRKRHEECIAEIQAQKLKPEDAIPIQEMLVIKETRHLRSLRARVGPKDFIEIQKLGAGHIGNVFLVERLVGNQRDGEKRELYAMKKLKKSQVFKQNHMAHVMAERDILAEADNDWIVRLYWSFQDEDYLYFILAYIPGGDLMNLLVKQSVFPEEWARFYIAEISLALQFVHDMKFIHRDIKPDNILIDSEGHIKLTDFGLCTGFRWTHDLKYYYDDTVNMAHELGGNQQLQQQQQQHQQQRPQQQVDDHPTITRSLAQRQQDYSRKQQALSLVGSPNYIAPEVLQRDRYSDQSVDARLCDWWSVGVILYEMVVGYCPFIDIEMVKMGSYNASYDLPSKIQARIKDWQNYLAFPSPTDPNSPPQMTTSPQAKPHFMSPETRALIEGWLCEPYDRLCQNGINDIKDHPFFRGIDWQNIRLMPAPYKPELRGEIDTQHFDQFLPEHHRDSTHNGSRPAKSKVSMPDFTYKPFWKPPNN